MRRLLTVFAVVALIAVACAPSDGAPSTTSTGSPDSTGSSVAPATDAPDGSGDATTTTDTPDATATTAPASDRPLAPDFTLELGDGGSYTLSEGSKPVYLVFWAEW